MNHTPRAPRPVPAASRGIRGFTLVELMITLVVLAVALRSEAARVSAPVAAAAS